MLHVNDPAYSFSASNCPGLFVKITKPSLFVRTESPRDARTISLVYTSHMHPDVFLFLLCSLLLGILAAAFIRHTEHHRVFMEHIFGRLKKSGNIWPGFGLPSLVLALVSSLVLLHYSTPLLWVAQDLIVLGLLSLNASVLVWLAVASLRTTIAVTRFLALGWINRFLSRWPQPVEAGLLFQKSVGFDPASVFQLDTLYATRLDCKESPATLPSTSEYIEAVVEHSLAGDPDEWFERPAARRKIITSISELEDMCDNVLVNIFEVDRSSNISPDPGFLVSATSTDSLAVIPDLELTFSASADDSVHALHTPSQTMDNLPTVVHGDSGGESETGEDGDISVLIGLMEHLKVNEEPKPTRDSNARDVLQSILGTQGKANVPQPAGLD